MLEYVSLFLTAFASATLLPMGSEGLLIYLIDKGGLVTVLVAVASLANTLGSLLNYLLGLKGMAYIVEKKLVSPERAERTHRLFGRYGGYSLLFSWVPLIGDPITFIAGAAGYDMKRFILLVALAKTGRYLFLAGTFIYFT